MKKLLSADAWKDHVAIYKRYYKRYDDTDDTLETLQWKNPHSSNYAVWYVRQHGTLMVWGDVGAATYRWHHDVDMQTISENSLNQFVSKCVASSVGKSPYYWDGQQAEKDMQAYFAEEYDERDAEAVKFKQALGWEALGEDRSAWTIWLRENARDTFGQDWYVHQVIDAGKMLDAYVKLHHEGLELAWGQLKKA